MPRINKRKLCQKHGFYLTEESTQCPKCKKESNKTYDTNMRSKDRAKIYNSKKWKQVRELAILRDSMMCQECRRNGVDTMFDEVDHIIELQDRPDLAFELDNLQCLCKPCHSIKSRDERDKRSNQCQQ
jgi:5-methylcytosine-specific restriction protein A